MKAVVLHGPRDVRVQDIPVPEPDTGQILLDVLHSGICGSDLHWYNGKDPWGSLSLPVIAGHEYCGIVMAVGAGVVGIALGDAVAVSPSFERPDRRPQGFAEFALAEANRVMPIPQALETRFAALGDIYACGVHAADMCGVGPSSSVVVVGSGLIAVGAAVASRARGASVMSICKYDHVAEAICEAHTADVVMHDRKATAESVRDFCRGREACLIDAVGGSGEVLRMLVEAAPPRATICLAGSTWSPITMDYATASSKELTLKAPSGYRYPEDFASALDLMERGVANPGPFITHGFSLDDAEEAFEVARRKGEFRSIKVMFQM